MQFKVSSKYLLFSIINPIKSFNQILKITNIRPLKNMHANYQHPCINIERMTNLYITCTKNNVGSGQNKLSPKTGKNLKLKQIIFQFDYTTSIPIVGNPRILITVDSYARVSVCFRRLSIRGFPTMINTRPRKINHAKYQHPSINIE